MSSNQRNLSLLLILALLGGAGTAEAQAPLGTRAAGLAGAFVGVADDASAVYWNPAGLATGAVVSAIVTFASDETAPKDPQTAAGERHTGTMVALSLPPVGLAYYRVAAYGAEVATPAVTGPQSREEVRRSVHGLTTSTVGVSLVQSLSEHIVVGATPKVMRAAGRFQADVDAGVMAWANRFRFGLVARNLTTPKFGGDLSGDAAADEIELQREARIGGAWGSGWTGVSRVIVSVDGDVIGRAAPGGDRRDVAAGVETWWMSQRLGLRGGVRRSTIGDARAAVAAGISAGLTPGMLLEAHVVRGQDDERSWSVGARVAF
jgi:hypothetical protein